MILIRELFFLKFVRKKKSEQIILQNIDTELFFDVLKFNKVYEYIYKIPYKYILKNTLRNIIISQ